MSKLTEKGKAYGVVSMFTTDPHEERITYRDWLIGQLAAGFAARSKSCEHFSPSQVISCANEILNLLAEEAENNE